MTRKLTLALLAGFLLVHPALAGDPTTPIYAEMLRSHVGSLDAIDPAVCGSVDSNKILQSDLGVWTCVDKPTSSANPLWSDIVAPAADTSFFHEEFDTDWIWRTGANTAAVFDGLTVALQYRPDTTDSGDQHLVRIVQLNVAGSQTGQPEALLFLENIDTTPNDAAAAAIKIRALGGGFPIGLDLNDADIATVLATVGNSLVASDFDLIDDGVINLATEVTGLLPLTLGGAGTDLTAFGDSLLGTDGASTLEVNTEALLETALGGINVLLATEIDGAGEFAPLVPSTGTGAVVFENDAIIRDAILISASFSSGITLLEDIGAGQKIVLPEAFAGGGQTLTIQAPTAMAADRTCLGEDDDTPFDGCVTHVSTINELDTSASGLNLDQLTDGSDADDLHIHSTLAGGENTAPVSSTWHFPPVNPAQPGNTSGIFGVPIILFQNEDDRSISQRIRVPDDFDGTTNVPFVIEWATTAVTNDVCFCVQTASVTLNGDTTPAATDTDCEDDSADPQAEELNSLTITVTAADFVAGQWQYIHVYRDTEGLDGNCTLDNLGAEAQFHDGTFTFTED